MDVETPTENTETPTEAPETTEEREKRTRKSAPLRLFTGSDEEGWKPVATPAFADEREARRWAKDNGRDGACYRPFRDYGAFRVVPRHLEEV